ncbi:MAG: universal stress protein [Gemmatimonadota bacterium]
MIPATQIRSVLVASDLLEGSDDLLRSASELALATEAELHVVHAYGEPSVLSREPRELLDVQRQVHERRARLHDQVARSVRPGIRTGIIRVSTGTPSASILEAADDIRADVILLGAHRDRGIADRYLGSTAERVLGRTSVPCLVLNGPLTLPIRKIVVPTDQSAPAQRALQTALRWAGEVGQRGQPELALAHVLDASDGDQPGPHRRLDLRQGLEQAVAEARGDTGADLPVRIELLEGDTPANSLVDFIEADGSDLIVMGTHGDGLLVRVLLGSVSSALFRRTTVPLLMVPRRATSTDLPEVLVDDDLPEPVAL